MSEEKKEIPVIKATKVERTERPDGGVDVKVFVPRLALKSILDKRKEEKNG